MNIWIIEIWFRELFPQEAIMSDDPDSVEDTSNSISVRRFSWLDGLSIVSSFIQAIFYRFSTRITSMESKLSFVDFQLGFLFFFFYYLNRPFQVFTLDNFGCFYSPLSVVLFTALKLIRLGRSLPSIFVKINAPLENAFFTTYSPCQFGAQFP